MPYPADLHRTIARRIRELAAEHDIPLTHVADRAGISRAGLWHILGGRKSPSVSTLARVADVLEVQVQDLLTPAPTKTKA